MDVDANATVDADSNSVVRARVYVIIYLSLRPRLGGSRPAVRQISVDVSYEILLRRHKTA